MPFENIKDLFLEFSNFIHHLFKEAIKVGAEHSENINKL